MSLLSRLAVQAAKAYGALSKGGVSASYLVVAGGAGGGGGEAGNGYFGGGGGAGGLLSGTATLSTLNTYTVVVGAGGAGKSTATVGNSGNLSSLAGTGLTTISSAGGGGGGASAAPYTYTVAGATGGSGGGGQGYGTGAGGAGNTPSTSPSQGNNGGAGGNAQYGAGGGGGAGAVGGAGTTVGGTGGAGTASSISGSSVTYAGGGGGSCFNNTVGAGGAGGGGNGGSNAALATSGTANLGGGGGGGERFSTGLSGAGGSGVVIISYTSATPKFVGGTLTTSGGNQIHTFTSSGTLSPLTPVTASYLVVAGGGGGSTYGGGGAGGLLTSSTTIYSGATYVVTVGAGGAGDDYASLGVNGNNSVLSGTGLTTLTAIGGGGGASSLNASSGGSGGGGGSGNGAGTGGAGTSGQGFAGGNAASGTAGGGGGGAGAVGGTGVLTTAGNGGAGTASSISGSSVTYAGGGGGGTYNGVGIAGTGGNGGGGNGSITVNGDNGTSNLGGGGGGGRGGAGDFDGGAGGSGTVIISYAGSQVFNGGLVTTSGGNTIHTFNATGALTPVTNNLNNSLRFRKTNSAYLSRTPALNGNRKTWTYSVWLKRGSLADYHHLLAAGTGTQDQLLLDVNDTLIYYEGSTAYRADTVAVLRDPSAWYHIVVVRDSTQATSTNRIKIYINGNQQTVTNTSYPALNSESKFNNNEIQTIGVAGVVQYLDGYLADVNFIDGQALEPYYFGNNDAYGNWKPILYKGMYGTNGFFLNFSDTTALTTTSNAGLGKDTSGNGNYWATNNISITAGVTYDAMLDVPTNTSATVANYAVLNPLSNLGTAQTLSDGNLKLTNPSSTWGSKFSTIGVSSGKWYAEFTVLSASLNIVGVIADADTTITGTDKYLGNTANSYGYFHSNGNKYNNGTGSAYGASYTTNDVIGVALDMDAGTLTFYKNNTSQGTAYSSLSGVFYIGCSVSSALSSSFAANFGQRPFAYTPPANYVALNTFNLPTPTILQGNKYMDATLYTGNGSSQTIVNAGQFKPDLVWTKARSIAYSHVLYDSVRGTGTTKALYSDATSVEGVDTNLQNLTSYNSNGWSVGSAATINIINASGQTFVGWQWQAGQSSGSSNTSGSITSTVSASTTAGFSVVTYTGSGAAGTVGHGLGVAPAMIITKKRSNAGGGSAATNWVAWHKSLSGAFSSTTGYIYFNDTAAAATTTNFYDGTAMTSTTFRWQTGNDNINYSNDTFVAYCWAEIAGFSKFGSYTGNGSADGPFVYTGFRPKYVMVKSSSYSAADTHWHILDTSRNTANPEDKFLNANTSGVEDTYTFLDILSNGFKLRQNGLSFNGSGTTYIYMAFAENPFNNSNAR